MNWRRAERRRIRVGGRLVLLVLVSGGALLELCAECAGALGGIVRGVGVG